MNKMATIDDAIRIAAQAHKGQRDKAGAPYILHPIRLMLRMKTETEMMVAVLHDVVEDSRDKKNENDRWTFDKLQKEGFPIEVIEALECVTNREDETYQEFIKRAGNNPIARNVKIADLEDNMNILRIGDIKPKDLERLEKYHKSWCVLTQQSK